MILNFDIGCNYNQCRKVAYYIGCNHNRCKTHFSTSVITTSIYKHIENDFLHHFVINVKVKYTKIKNLNLFNATKIQTRILHTKKSVAEMKSIEFFI